jgi:2-polyprenyl-3-methyl-5-hydroxy-6-metoxy-1,4-benzoquinol methylase
MPRRYWKNMHNPTQEEIFNSKYGRDNHDLSEMYVQIWQAQQAGTIRWFPKPITRYAESWVLDFMEPDPDTRVLDVGCGVGSSFVPFIGNVRLIHGIDFSSKGIARARKTFSAYKGPTKFQFSVVDYFRLNRNKFYNIVSMQTFVEHLESQDQAEKSIRKAYSLLKKNGKIIIYTVNRNFVVRTLYRLLFPGRLKESLDHMGHQDEVFYTVLDLEKMLHRQHFHSVRSMNIFTPIESFIELSLYPRYLRWYLVRRLNASMMHQFVYDRIAYPLLRILCVLDLPFRLLGNSSGIIVLGKK